MHHNSHTAVVSVWQIMEKQVTYIACDGSSNL